MIDIGLKKLFLIMIFLLYTCFNSDYFVYAVNTSKVSEITAAAKIETVYKSTKEKFHKTDNLKVNVYSKDVRRLNYILNKLGYNTTDSYYFSNRTLNAVIRFQSNNRLTPDGIVGQRTINALNNQIQIKKISMPNFSTKVTASPTSNFWIAINKSRNCLYLIRGKNVVCDYPITVGAPNHETPEGKFKIVIKAIKPSWRRDKISPAIPGGVKENPLGNRWMGLNIGNGYLYGIHGTNRPKDISTHFSKGCIRLLNKNVEHIFEIVPKGTIVWIGSENTLRKYGIEERMYLTPDL